MGFFKNVVEPACIFGFFTAGALINHRGRRPIVDRGHGHDSPASPEGWAPPKRVQSPASMIMSRFDRHILSRFLHCFPFLMEILYWNLTYWVYQLARAYSATLIRDDDSVMNKSAHHALQILDLETRLGIAVEKPLQDAVLSHAPWLMGILTYVYYSHISVGVAFIAYAYTYFPYRRFAAVRRTLFADNWISFVIFTAWRCMPPRLLPFEEYGYIDILHAGNQGNIWTRNRFQLTIAAMPSLHFGTSVLLAASLWRFSPHAWLRSICFLWPTVMLITILATANHWILDAVVGACIPLLGWKINHAVSRLQPLEDLLFRILRTERPRAGESIEVLRREGYTPARGPGLGV